VVARVFTPDVRAALLFLTGLALTIREVVFEPRPIDLTLLLFYGGMMGLGPVLSKDTKKDGSSG
jgi:hypothetical protein